MKNFKMQKVLLTAVMGVATVVSLGLSTQALAKSLSVTTLNQSPVLQKGRECVDSACKALEVYQAPVSIQLPEPSTGTAVLSAFFVSPSSTTTSCYQSYNVNTSSYAYVTIPSTGTSHCTIQLF